MELGQKLRQARIEAGLSQRQLCGEEITRNMLSLIENGSAKPSMKTLQYLAARLGKNLSYFLEENAVLSPNQSIMQSARELFDTGKFQEADELLKTYQSPDPVFDREKDILQVLIRLELAEDAIRQKRYLFARNLLEQTTVNTAYLEAELNRKKLLIQGRLPRQQIAALLPGLDEELFLRASEAFAAGNFQRSCHLLEAMEDHSDSRWHLLRGKAAVSLEQWAEAVPYLHRAEEDFPQDAYPLLEICYREQQDFQKAYVYACKQRRRITF